MPRTKPDDVLDNDILGVAQEAHELVGDPLPKLSINRHALAPSFASSKQTKGVGWVREGRVRLRFVSYM
jgi:hypothetical protein